MINDSLVMLPSTTVNASGSPLDAGTVLLAVAPFIIFLIVLWWGSKKKTRKKMTVEMAYNLIALQLLVFLFLPLCDQPFECGVWALVPIAMFAGLIAFVYYRMSKEAQHHMRVIRAIQDGHIGDVEAMQGQLEEEITEADKKPKKKREPEEKLEEGTEKKEEPEEKPKVHPEHKKIERVIHSVLKKKGAIKKKR